MTEIWKPIKGYEGLYQVSDHGNIYNMKMQQIQKPHKDMFGYLKKSLSDRDKRQKIFLVHRIVAIAFIDNPENKSKSTILTGIKKTTM